MKSLPSSIALVLWLTSAGFAVAAEFANLDFESAPLALATEPQGDFGTTGTVAERLPAWSFWLGQEPQTLVGHNQATVDGIRTSLHDQRPFGPPFLRYPSPPYDGNFGFLFQSQIQDPALHPSLRQTGTLPAGTQTIQIRVFGDPIRVYLNQVEIPLKYMLTSDPQSAGPYLPITYAIGEIDPAFVGKEIELRIEPDTENAIRTFSGIDNIRFLSESIVVAEVILEENEEDPIVLRRLK